MARERIKVDSWEQCVDKIREAVDNGGFVSVKEEQGMYVLNITATPVVKEINPDLVAKVWCIVREMLVYDPHTTKGESTSLIFTKINAQLDPRERMSNRVLKSILISKGLHFGQGFTFSTNKKTSIIKGVRFR